MSTLSHKTDQLVVRRRPTFHEGLSPLLQTLQFEYGLDKPSVRQRLQGPGLALFHQGDKQTVARVKLLLEEHGYSCWQIERQQPTISTDVLRSLKVHDDRVDFICKTQLVCLKRGASVVGVLADLSGGLVDKYLKRLLAQNAYRGTHSADVYTREQKIQVILQGQPVFDFYLLDSFGNVENAVQVMAGRFNVDGLGGRASLSSRQNLKALMALVEDYAGSVLIDCDFGLSSFPDCQVQIASDNGLAAVNNLVSLAYYGWMMTQLRSAELITAKSCAKSTETCTPEKIIPILGELSQNCGSQPDCLTGEAIGSSCEGVISEDQQRDFPMRHAAQTQPGKELPPPPRRHPTKAAPRPSLLTLGGLVAGASIAVAGGSDELLVLFANKGMVAGIIPGFAAALLLWGGFHYVHLKRQVENTPTSKIRSLALGMVEVHGRARRMYALVSPMTQSACVWYRLRKYRKGRKKKWRLIQQIDSSHVAFSVDDGTGRVVVNPLGATVKAKTQLTGYPDQFMKVLGTFERPVDPDEKWIEELIYEGTSLYVMGFAQPASIKRKSLKERTWHILRYLKLDHRALPRYDTDQNGHIDASEWQLARRDAEQEAIREQLAEQRNQQARQEDVVIAKGRERSLPFIITEATSEADLINKYRLFGISLLTAGLIAAVLAVFKFLQFLGSTQFN